MRGFFFLSFFLLFFLISFHSFTYLHYNHPSKTVYSHSPFAIRHSPSIPSLREDPSKEKKKPLPTQAIFFSSSFFVFFGNSPPPPRSFGGIRELRFSTPGEFSERKLCFGCEDGFFFCFWGFFWVVVVVADLVMGRRD